MDMSSNLAIKMTKVLFLKCQNPPFNQIIEAVIELQLWK